MREGPLLLAGELSLVVLLPEATEDSLDGLPRVVVLAGSVGVDSTDNMPRLAIWAWSGNP